MLFEFNINLPSTIVLFNNKTRRTLSRLGLISNSHSWRAGRVTMLSVPRLLFWATLFSLGSCGTTCSNQNYKSHLLFEDPLVIYIENFISREEASQLVGLR
jgi:hypothetical protein